MLELAKTLSQSSYFTTQPPSVSVLAPTPKKGKNKGANKPAKADEKAPPTLHPALGEPPVLPPGTYSTTATSPTADLSHSAALDLEMALAAKQQALEECSTMIDAAVEELQLMAQGGDQFWGQLRSLKNGSRGRGRWAVVPKPDFARSMAKGERARDVIIPYAVDEGEWMVFPATYPLRCSAAAPTTRARCLAAFDLDPSKKDALTFGARIHLRLRVTHTDSMGSTSSSLAPFLRDTEDVHAMMDAAQLEAFEEDVFNEVRQPPIPRLPLTFSLQIRNEALRDSSNDVEPTSVRIKLPHGDVTFQLVSITRRPEPS